MLMLVQHLEFTQKHLHGSIGLVALIEGEIMSDETWLAIERRNKNKIIKGYMKENTRLALKLSTLKAKLRRLSEH